jgi:hypothetical protein
MALAVSSLQAENPRPRSRRQSRESLPSAPAAEQPANSKGTAGTPTEIPSDHPLVPALKYAYSSREALKEVKDYTSLFIKREYKSRQMVTQAIDLKLRHEPFSVYMHFRTPEEGREVLYVDGANGGRLKVHEGSGIKAIAGTMDFNIDAPEVMKENKYPITKLGVANLLDAIIAQWEAETKFGEVSLKYFPKAKIGETQCVVFESTHPERRREFRFHKTRLYFEKDTRYPFRVEQYGFPRNGQGEPPLIEEYTYSNLKANVNLSGHDFSPRNPNYRF